MPRRKLSFPNRRRKFREFRFLAQAWEWKGSRVPTGRGAERWREASILQPIGVSRCSMSAIYTGGTRATGDGFRPRFSRSRFLPLRHPSRRTLGNQFAIITIPPLVRVTARFYLPSFHSFLVLFYLFYFFHCLSHDISEHFQPLARSPGEALSSSPRHWFVASFGLDGYRDKSISRNCLPLPCTSRSCPAARFTHTLSGLSACGISRIHEISFADENHRSQPSRWITPESHRSEHIVLLLLTRVFLCLLAVLLNVGGSETSASPLEFNRLSRFEDSDEMHPMRVVRSMPECHASWKLLGASPQSGRYETIS